MAGLQHARIGAPPRGRQRQPGRAPLREAQPRRVRHQRQPLRIGRCLAGWPYLPGRQRRPDLYNPGRSRAAASATASPGASPASISACRRTGEQPGSFLRRVRPPAAAQSGAGPRVGRQHRSLAGQRPFRPRTGRGAPAGFLGRLLAASGTRLPQRADPGARLSPRLQALLAERLAEPPDLDEMAEQVGLSKYHLPGVQEGHRAQPAPVEHATAHPPRPQPVAPWPGGGRGGPRPGLRRPEPPDPLLHQRLRHFAGPPTSAPCAAELRNPVRRRSRRPG